MFSFSYSNILDEIFFISNFFFKVFYGHQPKLPLRLFNNCTTPEFFLSFSFLSCYYTLMSPIIIIIIFFFCLMAHVSFCVIIILFMFSLFAVVCRFK